MSDLTDVSSSETSNSAVLTQPNTLQRTPRTTLPVADRIAAVLADADLRHRNPAHAQMIATTTVAQVEAMQERRGW